MSVTGKLKQRYLATRVAHVHARAESRFVNVAGANLHFVIKGEGRAVVLIHGNPGSCQDWSRLYVPISRGYRALAFDRPGHGHSDRPNHRPITVEFQAELLHAALAELQIERPIIVGHSWGGSLALVYALMFQHEVSGLVLLAPAAYESNDGVSFLSKLPGWPVIGDVLNFLFTPLLSAWLVRTDIAKAFAPDPVPEKYMRHVLAEWTRPKKVKWYSVDDALLNESLPKFAARYGEIDVPMAIVAGDSDQIVPSEQNAGRLYQALPNSYFHLLARTGHQIPFTRPDAVLTAIDHVAALSAPVDFEQSKSK